MTGKPSWAASGSVDLHADDGPSLAILAQVSDAMRGLRFGQVTIIIQDGVVVQIDRLEKHRLAKSD
jgi:hypothetical protein